MTKSTLKQFRLEEDVINLIKEKKGDLNHSQFLRNLLTGEHSESANISDISEIREDLRKVKKLLQLVAVATSQPYPDLHKKIMEVYKP